MCNRTLKSKTKSSYSAIRHFSNFSYFRSDRLEFSPELYQSRNSRIKAVYSAHNTKLCAAVQKSWWTEGKHNLDLPLKCVVENGSLNEFEQQSSTIVYFLYSIVHSCKVCRYRNDRRKTFHYRYVAETPIEVAISDFEINFRLLFS